MWPAGLASLGSLWILILICRRVGRLLVAFAADSILLLLRRAQRMNIIVIDCSLVNWLDRVTRGLREFAILWAVVVVKLTCCLTTRWLFYHYSPSSLNSRGLSTTLREFVREVLVRRRCHSDLTSSSLNNIRAHHWLLVCLMISRWSPTAPIIFNLFLSRNLTFATARPFYSACLKASISNETAPSTAVVATSLSFLCILNSIFL